MDMETGVGQQPVQDGIFQHRLKQKLNDTELFQFIGNLDGQMQAVEIADIIYVNQRGGIVQFRFDAGIKAVSPEGITEQLAEGGDGIREGVLSVLGRTAGERHAACYR